MCRIRNSENHLGSGQEQFHIQNAGSWLYANAGGRANWQSPATIYKHYYAITNPEEVRAKMNQISKIRHTAHCPLLFLGVGPVLCKSLKST